MDPTSETQVELLDEEAVCVDCQKAFTRKRMVIGGRSAPYASKSCEECVEKEEVEQPAAPDGRSRKDLILPLLDEAGVNVRKHGLCLLAEGKERGVQFDSTECGPEPLEAAGQFLDETLQAGRWGAVLGLLMMGPLGSGKTHLAAAIVRAVLLYDRIDAGRVIFDRADRLITMIQDTYGTGGTSAILERRERAHLLVIDDLGREKATPDTLRILVDLVNAREGHPTVITSNHTPQGLIERFKDANAEGSMKESVKTGLRPGRMRSGGALGTQPLGWISPVVRERYAG